MTSVLEPLDALGLGLALGAAGGITPGPTTALVVTQTLRYGVRAGMLVALGPLLSDAPIVIAAVTLTELLARWPLALSGITWCGAVLLLVLAWDTWRARIDDDAGGAVRTPARASLRLGAYTNFFNPHPHLFWFLIGAPIVWRAAAHGPVAVAAFLIGQYLCLVGGKILLAVAVGRVRTLMSTGLYRCVVRTLAVMLAVLAVMFLHDGWHYLQASGQ